MRKSVLWILLAAGAAPAVAETDATCAGTVSVLPAVISTQGTWCLRGDLSTAMASGTAITVATNNVTLDCNGFKIGGTAAGPATAALGVWADGRSSVTVRNCSIRGFSYGVALESPAGGGGHRVTGNLVEGSTIFGIWLSGDGSLVDDNRVLSTGLGTTGNAYGIRTIGAVDIVGNTVTDVFPSQSIAAAGFGIYATANAGGRVSRNLVRGVREGTFGPSPGGAAAIGVDASSTNVAVEDNTMFYVGEGAGFSLGLKCYGDTPKGVATGNDMIGFAFPYAGCRDGGGNEVH